MTVLDIPGDAGRVVDVLRGGGVAIIPMEIGYAGLGGCEAALTRFFRAKGRGAHKRNAMLGSLPIHDEVHVLEPQAKGMVRALVEDYDLPVSVVAPYRPDHPLLRALGEGALEASSDGGTVAVLLNAGALQTAVAERGHAVGQPVFGSSANLTGTGTRFRAADIQPEIRAAADLVVDYGLMKYHAYRRSSTMIDFRTMEVIRIGSCYELVCDVLGRHFGVELPPDPGLETLPSGHVREAQRRYGQAPPPAPP